MRLCSNIFLALVPLAVPIPIAAAAGGDVSFNWDVRPILSENCYTCHGPDDAQRKGDLRLDVRASLADPDRRGGPLIDPDDSELLRRIASDDPDDRMPPPDHGDALTDAEIAVLTQWVQEGAEYEPHWSLVKPERPDAPETGGSWARNDIDRFIYALLDEKDIAPSPEADQRTLIRRAYLDLTGIPPTPGQVDAFVNDDQPGAYERVVDELLASPHFGERWARHWLDAARYADSNGYSIDAPRSIWPYRDWVIDAINENKPFDEFVVEQIAGDLLPDATRDQRVATGFHRNTMINEEGGVDEEEFRVKAIIDRVNTTGAVFFGLTLGCAQCHTHKYDPVTQDEYFGLFAFYNNDDYATEVVSPEAVVEERRRLDREASDLSKALREYIDASLPEWEAGLDDDSRANLPEDVRAVLSSESRDEDQVKKLAEYFAGHDEEAKARQKTSTTSAHNGRHSIRQ
jgi:mono/diheme cytochrome c family protein